MTKDTIQIPTATAVTAYWALYDDLLCLGKIGSHRPTLASRQYRERRVLAFHHISVALYGVEQTMADRRRHLGFDR